MTQAEPFDFGDLPENISRQFRLKNGVFDAGFVLVYPAVSLDDGIKRRFATEVRSVVEATSSTKYLAGGACPSRYHRPVFGEAPRLQSSPCSASSWRCFCSSAISRDMHRNYTSHDHRLCARHPSMTNQVDYLNMVMLPVLFGIAVDGGVTWLPVYVTRRPP